MDYANNKNALRTLYRQKGIENNFDKDNKYLEKAFSDINKLWLDNFDQIKKVNYLMVAEAPLWGRVQKFIYNPDINNSQFFYRSDLGDILNKFIADKQDFLKVCNEIGLLVVDISPFALNPVDTKINYRELSTNEYRQLVSLTIPTYFEEKIKKVNSKKSKDIKVFFRYARVRDTFQDLIAKILLDNKFIKNINEIGDISQNGGGIDKEKLKKIIETQGGKK